MALARAVARCSPATDDRLVVSEVNWPLEEGGIYSPIGAPYLYPGQQLAAPPSVTEDDYADYMLRYLLITLCSGMAERVYWWRLVHRGFGLVDDTHVDAWRKRPAFEMLKYFLSKVGTAVFEQQSSTSSGVQSFRFKRGDGTGVVVAYGLDGVVKHRPTFGYECATDAFGSKLEASPQGIEMGGRPVYFIGVSD